MCKKKKKLVSNGGTSYSTTEVCDNGTLLLLKFEAVCECYVISHVDFIFIFLISNKVKPLFISFSVLCVFVFLCFSCVEMSIHMF